MQGDKIHLKWQEKTSGKNYLIKKISLTCTTSTQACLPVPSLKAFQKAINPHHLQQCSFLSVAISAGSNWLYT